MTGKPSPAVLRHTGLKTRAVASSAARSGGGGGAPTCAPAASFSASSALHAVTMQETTP
jgi:hypothetical protein